MIASSLVARLTASIQRPPLGMPSALTAVWRTANKAPTQDGTVRGSKIARAHSSGVCPAAFSVAIVVVAAQSGAGIRSKTPGTRSLRTLGYGPYHTLPYGAWRR